MTLGARRQQERPHIIRLGIAALQSDVVLTQPARGLVPEVPRKQMTGLTRGQDEF
jgi:hypothetical protein